jgi:hypothetical protein
MVTGMRIGCCVVGQSCSVSISIFSSAYWLSVGSQTEEAARSAVRSGCSRRRGGREVNEIQGRLSVLFACDVHKGGVEEGEKKAS